jgi:hypothetical protein
LLIKIRAHLSFANVISIVALFVALGGTSYAVTKVGSKNIKKNAVRTKHIKRSQVTSGDIRNRTIGSQDLAPGLIGGTLQATAGQARRDAGPAGIPASQNYTTVATLSGLQPGAYVLLAKANQSANIRTEGRCRVSAEGDYDDSSRGLRENSTPEAHALQLVHSFAGAGTVTLSCRSAHGEWGASDSKIVAIRVSSATSNIVGG